MPFLYSPRKRWRSGPKGKIPLFGKWFDRLTILSLSKERGQERFRKRYAFSIMRLITQALCGGMSMTISRHWKGIAKPEEADHYIHHLRNDTFPKLAGIEGFIKASILTRPIDEGTEFLIVTTWQSMEAIHKFAGESASTAVVPPPVQLMMVEYDREVTHYEIVEEYSP